ncbi:MAG: ABC transporter ATP-binding protein [Microvirga sp.]|jgi:sulfonate transport system ATP-binding protein|nr:ATP-binding cassette domain-containing protein [Beijerinckiaceae bacterium]
MPGAGASPPLEIDIQRKIYRNGDGRSVEAVRNLAFSIQPHSFVCLIGPSGCGKTTILRIVLGLDRDFEGCVQPDLGDLPVGVVFQEPRLLPWRTVEENVRLALRSCGLAGTLDPLFAELDLEEWRHRYPGELSLGMARRAALARALAIEPDLLVLDEPFVSLDESGAAELRAIVSRLAARRRTTVILVTHNLREALGLADRLILLTARPASVLADIPLTTAREMRTDAWVEEGRRDLARRFAIVE